MLKIFERLCFYGLFTLHHTPNSMWEYITSVYYLVNRENGLLNDRKFYEFLHKITAFTLMYSLMGKYSNSFTSPLSVEMLNIVEEKPFDFKKYRTTMTRLERAFDNYEFTNNKGLTKFMLAWWAFVYEDTQELLPLDTPFEIEEINKDINSDTLGNKSLLEKSISTRAAKASFKDKVKYYAWGFKKQRRQYNDGTQIQELQYLANYATDFTEHDIEVRNKKIRELFIAYVKANDLIES